jgi:hypothetical protein
LCRHKVKGSKVYWEVCTKPVFVNF